MHICFLAMQTITLFILRGNPHCICSLGGHTGGAKETQLICSLIGVIAHANTRNMENACVAHVPRGGAQRHKTVHDKLLDELYWMNGSYLLPLGFPAFSRDTVDWLVCDMRRYVPEFCIAPCFSWSYLYRWHELHKLLPRGWCQSTVAVMQGSVLTLTPVRDQSLSGLRRIDRSGRQDDRTRRRRKCVIPKYWLA